MYCEMLDYMALRFKNTMELISKAVSRHTYIYDMVVDRVKRKMHICFLFSDSFSFPSLE